MDRPTWIGRTLSGRYRIDAMLGRGGMSAVYKATDPNLKRPVAVKLIHEHLSSDPLFVQRFESEAEAVASLRHPNIVQVFDFNHDGDIFYMVLEFIPGETLQERLKQFVEKEQKLPIEEAVRITLNISDAVGYAHQHDIVHRDIKPANIMLDLQGRAILMDFGIVKILGGESHTSTGAVVGTVPYMSPEVIRGETADLRSDIYSLGIAFYEMLSGRPPFVADSTMTVMMMHLNDPVPDVRDFRSEIPPALVDILEKCLAKVPEYRYQTAAELSSDLRRALVNLSDETADVSSVRVKKAGAGEAGLDEDDTNTVESVRDTAYPYSSVSIPIPKKSSSLGPVIGCLAAIIVVGLLFIAGISVGLFSVLNQPTSTSLPPETLVPPTKAISVLPTDTETTIEMPTPMPTTAAGVITTNTLPIRIAYVVGQQEVNSTIFIVDANGASKKRLTNTNCSNAEPDWSPDGTSLVYQSNCSGSYDIWRIGADGKDPHNLIDDGTMDEREPDYSPSGGELAYVRRPKNNNYNSNGDIRIYEFGGRDYSTGLQGRAPVYSPDGSRLAYMSFDGTYWQLFVYNIATRQNVQLTLGNNDARWPAWSPDGESIAYNSATGQGSTPTGIWIVSVDGGYPEAVTGKGNYGRPHWSGTGLILYNDGTDGLWIIQADGLGSPRQITEDGFAGVWSR